MSVFEIILAVVVGGLMLFHELAVIEHDRGQR